MRIPRRIRASGIALRKLIRSRSVAGSSVSGTGGGQFHRPQPMLTTPARELVTHFESALGQRVAEGRTGGHEGGADKGSNCSSKIAAAVTRISVIWLMALVRLLEAESLCP
jgi:hypothetical protein